MKARAGIDVARPGQVLPGGLRVFVHLRLGRKPAVALAVTAIIDGEHGKTHAEEASDVLDVAADVEIVAVEKQEYRRRGSGGR